MSSQTVEERFMEIWVENQDAFYSEHVLKIQGAAVRQFLTEFAVIPRPEMPVLNEDGRASIEWWAKVTALELEDFCRLDAAYSLARAEWCEAQETRDAEAKLSERRNNVLAEWRERIDSPMNNTYENSPSNTRVLVDMVIEAQDRAGK